MSSPRSDCAAVKVDARHVLVIGGQDSAYARLASTELLDVATMEFEPGPALRTGRYACACVKLEAATGPRIVVVGGSDGTDLASTEVLSLEALAA
jgi:spermidine synthase